MKKAFSYCSKGENMKRCLLTLILFLLLSCMIYAGTIEEDMKREIQGYTYSGLNTGSSLHKPQAMSVSSALSIVQGIKNSNGRYYKDGLDEVVANLEAILALPNLNRQLKERVEAMLNEAYAQLLE